MQHGNASDMNEDILSLADLICFVQTRLLHLLSKPPEPEVRVELDQIWAVCKWIHDAAMNQQDQTCAGLMERMIDAIADYNTYANPESIDWSEAVPSVEEIRMSLTES